MSRAPLPFCGAPGGGGEAETRAEGLAKRGVGLVAAEVRNGVDRPPLFRGKHRLGGAEPRVGDFAPDGAPRRALKAALKRSQADVVLAREGRRRHLLGEADADILQHGGGELLPPVVVLALYLGKEPWSGPMRLQEMVDVRNPELRAFMADCPANVVSLVDLAEETVWGMRSPLRPLSWLLRTQDDDVEMLRRAREDPLFLDAPSLLYRAFNELTGADLTVPRKKEHNNMCLAIEKMKEKGRLEERKKALKILEEERKKGICNLIEGCRKLGETFEKTCQLLMMCYHLTQSEAAAYLKEYYV